MKAQIPPEAPILIEVGSKKRPEEVEYEAKEPYSIVIVITNGHVRRKFIHINRRRSGIYLAYGMDGGFHESYHADGKRHWKGRGINEETEIEEDFVHDLPPGPPLDKLAGYVRLQNCGITVLDEFLSDHAEFNEAEGPFDKIVYLDNRALPPAINYEVILVEPFRHGLIPLFTDRPLHLELFTRCTPWTAVCIYENWPRNRS